MDARPWLRFYDYNVPTTIRYPVFPVSNFLHIAAAQYPHKAAVDFYGTEITFYSLRNQVLYMANALCRSGLKKGDRVGIALPNCPQYIIAYHAVLCAGAVVVNLNPFYTHDELKFMMGNSGLETLITYDEVISTMQPLAQELELKRVIVTKLSDYIAGEARSSFRSLDLEEGWLHFSEFIENCSNKSLPRVDFSPRDTALIQYTGGTTGVPKGAELTHGNIVASIFQASEWLNPVMTYIPHEKRNTIISVPQFHIYGNLCTSWALHNAATNILLPRFNLDEVMDILRRFDQISFFPCVPTMITSIINHPDMDTMKLETKLRYFHSGGAPIPLELIRQVKDRGINFGEAWGMSESSGLGISNPILGTKTGAIGIPLPDNDVRLVNVEDGVLDVKPGDPGEIIIRGPAVMKRYWNNPEETAGQLTDGWLHTGDIAQADEDGYLYIVDRKKDMIIAGGFNIYPREVDEVLYQHPEIAEAVTVGIPDPYRGETVKACVVLKAGAKVTEKEISAFCREKLAPYKVPKIIEFCDALPKSAIGKILRKMLRDEEMAKHRPPV